MLKPKVSERVHPLSPACPKRYTDLGHLRAGPTLEEIARLFDGDDADVVGKDEVPEIVLRNKAVAQSAFVENA